MLPMTGLSGLEQQLFGVASTGVEGLKPLYRQRELPVGMITLIVKDLHLIRELQMIYLGCLFIPLVGS